MKKQSFKQRMKYVKEDLVDNEGTVGNSIIKVVKAFRSYSKAFGSMLSKNQVLEENIEENVDERGDD